jgi:isoquinoline 1-oxidoreductase beta subunit
LASVDAKAVNGMPGIVRVVQLEDAVAVVATGFWQAQQAVRALELKFTEVKGSGMDSAQLWAKHRALLDGDDARRKFRRGKGASALASAARSVTAEYQVPYLAHATMEPMSALVHVTESRCEVWTGSQDPLNARRIAARAARMDSDDVIMHNQLLGGGFGRRLPGNMDYIDQAVRIAKQLSPRPVKMIWNRETDMRCDYYRPASVARFRGGLGADNRLQTWACDFTGPGGNAARPIYAVEHQEIRSARAPKHLRTGPWRSVEHSSHGFFLESFVDEVAHAAGQDPLQYRRELLEGKPRHIAVLDRVAKMSGWGTTLPPGQGRGVAIVESFGSIVAEVAVVAVDTQGNVAVREVFAAVDCGPVIHPDGALAQVEGGIIFGLSAAMYQEITVAKGSVEQSSFPDFPMITLANAPRVKVEFVDSAGPLGGIGEVGVPPIAPALTNAIFAASGYRVRTLPVKNHTIVKA